MYTICKILVDNLKKTFIFWMMTTIFEAVFIRNSKSTRNEIYVILKFQNKSYVETLRIWKLLCILQYFTNLDDV